MSNPKMMACKTCGQQIAKSAQVCPHCGARNFNVAAFLGVFFSMLLIMLAILWPVLSTPDAAEPQTIKWAQQENYMFGVGVDGYRGDNFPDGIYTFTQTSVAKGKPPIVWDIYTSYNRYNSITELKEDEFRGSVGGLENDTLYGSIEGKYVYVIYHGTSESSGVLNIQIDPLE